MKNIESYSFGKIVIDGREYSSDVIIFPDKVESNWWRKEGHSLYEEDIKSVLERRPEVLVVGTGSMERLTVPPETRERVKSEGIKLIIKPTEKACKTYNEVLQEKDVAAALHLTC